MKIKVRDVRCVRISGEYIKLDALLKFASVVSTGGEAKQRIKNGEVTVGKNICTLRGKKLRPGDVVRLGGSTVLVRSKNI